jgi:hypothetical protein
MHLKALYAESTKSYSMLDKKLCKGEILQLTSILQHPLPSVTKYPFPGYQYAQSIGIQDERNQQSSLAPRSYGVRPHVHRDRVNHERGDLQSDQHNPSSGHSHTPGTFQLGDRGTSV